MQKPQLREKPDKAEVSAIKALYAGTADKVAQKIALDYIIYKLCRTYELPFGDTDAETNLAIGKAFVGAQIVGIAQTIDMKQFSNKHEDNS